MKEVLKEDNKKALFLNLVVAVGIVALLIVVFFKVYLPLTTDHGDTMKVPNIVGKLESEASKILEENKLRYEIIDSTYAPELSPLAVVRQYPSEGSEVKEKRKIYLTVNYAQSPTVEVPDDMIDHSLKNAKTQLKRKGLVLGSITEKNSEFKENVIGVIIDGKEISKENLKKGFLVKKGQVVDLIIGDGKSKKTEYESNNSVEDDSNSVEEPDNSGL
ncbi:MAG: beta-lactam-binding protein with PASTA domain [Flammeovirgaceae bacterium]|jgi:beta-lactam-binding protein with PASTA domain